MNNQGNRKHLKDLYTRFMSKELSKKSTLKSLSDLIENCDEDDIRIDSVKAISKLKIKNKKIYKILEKCLLSDESPKVRELAARFLIMDYPKICKEVILWALKNDKSPSVLKAIEDLSCGMDGHKLEFLDE